MRKAASCYALVGIEAVPVYVIVDGDRATIVEHGGRRVLGSVRLLDRRLREGSVPDHVVSGRTLAQGRSTPADVKEDEESEGYEFGLR